MKYYIPTYKECREICDANDNFTFYESFHEVEGYKISIFNYRLAQPGHFYNPIENSEITAHELRGLTFVWNKDGSLYNRYILLDKFFNLNQSECSSLSLLKDEPIKEITYKEDGSVASFIELPNGKIIGRSKASFISTQAIEVVKIYENTPSIKNLVDYCFGNGIIPIFEYVSPKNRIVLQYKKTDLILIKLRNNTTGQYIRFEELPTEFTKNVTIAERINATLNELITKCQTDTGYEGYVVTFENGKMIKLKLIEYCNLHNLHTEDLHRENSIVWLIVKEQIDDILCQLEDSDERKTMVLELIYLVNAYIKQECIDIIELTKKYTGDKKSYALQYINHIHFGIAIHQINTHIRNFGDAPFVIDDEYLVSCVKNQLIENTKHLMAARKWVELNKIKFKKN